MSNVQQLTIDHPDHISKILDMTTYVDRNLGYADVFANVEVTGNPVGIVRKSVAILEWRNYGERWLCVRHRGLRGTDAMMGASGS